MRKQTDPFYLTARHWLDALHDRPESKSVREYLADLLEDVDRKAREDERAKLQEPPA